MGRGIASGMHGAVVLMLAFVVPGAFAVSRDVHNLLELQTAMVAHNVDTINIMNNIEFKGEIPVNRAVTLHGNTVARVVMDATNTDRHFLVGPGADVVFSNLHFTNVKVPLHLTIVVQSMVEPPFFVYARGRRAEPRPSC